MDFYEHLVDQNHQWNVMCSLDKALKELKENREKQIFEHRTLTVRSSELDMSLEQIALWKGSGRVRSSEHWVQADSSLSGVR